MSQKIIFKNTDYCLHLVFALDIHLMIWWSPLMIYQNTFSPSCIGIQLVISGHMAAQPGSIFPQLLCTRVSLMASLGLKILGHVLCSLTCKPGYGDAQIRSDRATRKLRKRKVEDLANHTHQVQKSLKRLKNTEAKYWGELFSDCYLQKERNL